MNAGVRCGLNLSVVGAQIERVEGQATLLIPNGDGNNASGKVTDDEIQEEGRVFFAVLDLKTGGRRALASNDFTRGSLGARSGRQPRRRRRANTIPTRPIPTSATVAGSGTGAGRGLLNRAKTDDQG